MERDEFLTKFGIGLLAVCTGCGLAGCGKDPVADNPTPGNNPPTNNPPTNNPPTNLVTADLATELTTVGSSKVANGVILVRVAAGNAAASFTAVQVGCTHQGTPVGYNNAQGVFICPNHGSQFAKDGALLQGPAATALRRYTVSIAGNALTVTA
ncbi:QcrA and Rieske domain-containing protein [Mucilaginibacter myungsuensis]|uniref:Rieske 2Fe-2S domain-containing protein n=1 Tax=Mucilaginibacter myungsuensis TaxID=649104 RepID=A0A929KYF6_9SPHI|nr:Rieske 2Fe-2S domain-containing protein [Mucilaginibacter myungsuensis]MBE9662228.1 Rieske 2Fe-2S domain-containing protein [Mucilaginibacter myungsuensis]MDN3599336.1 Rieske 2Fe-2S domain-containing protein [Mucilaginibacter myungsuensis]